MKFITKSGIGHSMSFDSGGQAEMAWRQPKCSCGWKGDTTYAYDDYQHTNIQQQYHEHYHMEKDN